MGPSALPGDDAASVTNLQASAHRLPVTFSRLGGADADSSPLAVRRRAFLFDQLLTDTQLVADGAYRWSRDAAARRGLATLRFERTALTALARDTNHSFCESSTSSRVLRFSWNWSR